MTIPTPVDDLGVTRDGLTQRRRYWRADSPRASVLMVHGIAEHSGRYDYLARYMAARGISVVAYDHRGFGESGGRRAFLHRFEQYVDDLEDHIVEVRRLDLPVVVVGHSMGGLITCALAASERAHADFYAVSAPALGAEVPSLLRRIAPVLSRWLPTLHIPQQFDSEVISRDPAVVTAYDNDPLVVPGATARLGAELFEAMDRTAARLDRIDQPMLVQHGTADELVPPRWSEPFEGLAGITRILYPGLRHEIFNEPEKDEVLGDLVGWIDQQLDS